MEKPKIVKSEFVKLRDEEYYTIDQLAKHYQQSAQTIKSIMKRWNMSTTIKGRKRGLPVDLIDDLDTNSVHEINNSHVIDIDK